MLNIYTIYLFLIFTYSLFSIDSILILGFRLLCTILTNLY